MDSIDCRAGHEIEAACSWFLIFIAPAWLSATIPIGCIHLKTPRIYNFLVDMRINGGSSAATP
jgi:hypothetical protein